MHHPENTNNAKYTYQMLQQSVEDMRTFIATKLKTTGVLLDDKYRSYRAFS